MVTSWGTEQGHRAYDWAQGWLLSKNSLSEREGARSRAGAECAAGQNDLNRGPELKRGRVALVNTQKCVRGTGAQNTR